ncbi:uncharacterized protein LOC127712890 [Mytilus californianus]|uniref:uncharacterized protein LOC127712890 n=1 Tax=Mytilus californianus TaxID=6549 RepID=UPI0022458AE5|nr:uncharacterized protein LOC127712890 [Mytilus californianus]
MRKKVYDKTVSGYSTSFEQPQRTVCRSYFVIRGTVISVIKIDGPPEDEGADNFAVYKYTILIIRKLKGPAQIKTGNEVIVETSGNGALCSLSLTVGEEYVLSGAQTAAGELRSFSYDIVYKVKDLGKMPLIRDYLLGTGRTTYKRNCNRGCTDISVTSSYCKTPDWTDPNFFFAIHCFSYNALCHMRNSECSWYNADSCQLSVMTVRIP